MAENSHIDLAKHINDFDATAAARATAVRSADRIAMVMITDASIPDDLVELAQRCGVEHVMREVWRKAYLAGFRAAAVRVDVTRDVLQAVTP